MSEKTEPALTPDEWASGIVQRGHYAVTLRDGVLTVHGVATSVIVPDELRHSLAALCLDGQPFGFTHEDVEAIRREANQIGQPTYDIFIPGDDERRRAALEGIAARIAALLPKETTHA